MGEGGTDLDRATSIEGSDGQYVAHLSDAWEIWGPNGGYLASIALRAAGSVAQIPQPASFYCHFLNSPAFDAVELRVAALKQGRRAESFAVEMTQDGKPILYALVKTAADAPGHNHQHATAPDVPPPTELKPYEGLFSPRERPRLPSGTGSSAGPSTRAPRKSRRTRSCASGPATDRVLASRTPSSTPPAR